VVGPEGVVTPDIKNKLPGRGIWVSADKETVEKAEEKRVFERSARRSVSGVEDLAARVEGLLVKQTLNAIGLARKAGQLSQGFAKVEGLVRSNNAALLFSASDSGADGRTKLARLANKGQNVKIIGCLSGAELSLALGRENVVHAAVNPGRFAERISAEVKRLEGFRTMAPQDWGRRQTP
jgi:hypothetical protein